MKTKLIAIGVVVAVAVAAFFLLRPKKDENEQTLLAAPVKPDRPPPPGAKRERVPMPTWPKVDRHALKKTYDEAKAAGVEQPGDVTFRSGIDAFMAYNMEFARAKMKEEGLSMKEVEELTYFGFKVMTSQVPSVIEDATGTAMSEEQLQLLDDLKMGANKDFTETMRTMVADGASEQERWAYIKQTDENYMAQYFAITGMTPEQWDDVLVMSAIEVEIPDTIEPRPYAETQPRPSGPGTR